MEEGVSRLPEHSRHLVVVVSHQLWLGGLLGKSKQAMDVLNSLESFLETPETVNTSATNSFRLC